MRTKQKFVLAIYVPAASFWLMELSFLSGLFSFFNTLLLEDGWLLVNGTNTIILNHSQKQGVPSEGHLSLSLQPHCCKFTRHCFMYRCSHSELAWMGRHQKARRVLHEKHQPFTPGHSPEDQLLMLLALRSLNFRHFCLYSFMV